MSAMAMTVDICVNLCWQAAAAAAAEDQETG